MTANDTTELSRSFEETLANPDMAEAFMEAGDRALEQLFPALDHVPLLKWFKAATSTVTSVRDYLLIKKITAFLGGLRSLTPGQRAETIHRLDQEPAYARRAGEALITILDRIDSETKAVWVARALRAYAAEHIDATQLMRLNAVIERVLLCDVGGIREALRNGSTRSDAPYAQAAVQAGLAYAQSSVGVGNIHVTNEYAPFMKFILDDDC